MSRLIVAGLDLSLTSTGVAHIEWDSDRPGPVWTVKRVTSSGKAGASLAERTGRLTRLYRQVTDLAAGADLVVVEGPSFGQARQGGQHDRAGLWWLVVDVLANEYATPVAEVPPTVRAKYATGAGNAGKDAVLAAVVKRYPDVDVTGNDIADAVVLAAMGARHLGRAVDALPTLHLAAMSKVRWPEPLAEGSGDQ